MRSSRASARGSWLSLPGRCASTSASDWSANSGWRSHTDTISSIGIVSIHPARRASASARELRSTGSSMPADDPIVITPL